MTDLQLAIVGVLTLGPKSAAEITKMLNRGRGDGPLQAPLLSVQSVRTSLSCWLREAGVVVEDSTSPMRGSTYTYPIIWSLRDRSAWKAEVVDR